MKDQHVNNIEKVLSPTVTKIEGNIFPIKEEKDIYFSFHKFMEMHRRLYRICITNYWVYENLSAYIRDISSTTCDFQESHVDYI